MTDRSPDQPIPAWKATTFLKRLCECKSMLSVHGFLSEAENSRVEERLKRYVNRDAERRNRGLKAK